MLALALLLAQSLVPGQDTQSAAYEFTGESSTFGNLVAPAGDQDGDGTPDVLIGESQDYGVDCWILSGREGTEIGSYHLELNREWRDVDECVSARLEGGRDFLVLSIPTREGESSEVALVSAATGREVWHAPARRSGLGRLRAHLVPQMSTSGTQDPASKAPLELALFCLYSCRWEALLDELAHPKSYLTKGCGLFVIEDLASGGRRELVVLIGLKRDRPSLVDSWPLGRREREQFAHAPEEWGGASGPIGLLRDIDGDGASEYAVAHDDRAYVISGRTKATLFMLAPKSKSDYALGFGSRIAPLDDVDGDGVADLVLSQTEMSPSGDTSFSGSVRAYSSKDRKQLWVSSPDNDEGVDEFGVELEVIGDVDGDGLTDLIVGTWEGSSTNPGYAAVLSGKTGATLFDFRRATSGIVVRKSPTAPTRFR